MGLRLFNGYGGFSEDGTEYVIVRRPPHPWINVIANEEAGFLISESGAGSTWSLNSRENRLTPWFNDPVIDPHGEVLYLRDDDDARLWSLTPGPCPAPAPYEVRHGFGYTTFRCHTYELDQELVCFVPRRDSIKLGLLRVTNRSARPRRLSFAAYIEWVLGTRRQDTARFVHTERDRDSGVILATNEAAAEYAGRVAVAAVAGPGGSPPDDVTADRQAFLGPSAAGLDPCTAFRLPLQLGPGESLACVFLLGQAESRAAALDLVRRYRDPVDARRALVEVTAFWRRTLGAVQVETPVPAIDLMLNGWLAYQNLSCRIWGRTALYQSGGAWGFRDQLQDAAALVYLAPDITRRQILLHAAHQFAAGDVLHWWHPPTSKGIRTRCSDDRLWLPYVAAFYVNATGDAALLDEAVPFVQARALTATEDEAFVVPTRSVESASVYEHCCRAIDRSLATGPRGLPLMGSGDWNDGMNRVGRGGVGESVWLGFFLCAVLDAFAPIAAQRGGGDADRAAAYRRHRAALGDALEVAGWDGEWYRRAYYDDGTPLGTAADHECRIDVIAQAWAVLSGVAPHDRAVRALAAVERQLVADGIIRLLAPPFDNGGGPRDPGYIRAYPPGVRENGGQYTHGALWAVRAAAELGRTDLAARWFDMLSPVTHTRTPGDVERYRVEPYVTAADVYGVAPYVGLGGWTWYTGSAGWMFRAGLESILGVTLSNGSELRVRPRLPADWPGYTVRYRPGDGAATYDIVVQRASGAPAVAARGGDARVEGDTVVIPLGRSCRVAISLGRAPRRAS